MPCKLAVLERIRIWIVEEEIRRAKRDLDEFRTNCGYLLALSNLVELLHEIEREVSCEHVAVPSFLEEV